MVLISGTGRGGTNLLTELVRKISDFKFTKNIEDRSFFSKKLKPEYATKLAVDHPSFSLNSIVKKLNNYKNLHIIFCIRHPIDNCLSKIVRGQKASNGGDKKGEVVSADGTLETSVKSVKKLYAIITGLQEKYSHRIIVVKMDDIIKKTDNVVEEISSFLDIQPKPHYGFQKNNRNKYQKKRYGDRLADQSNMYKDLDKNWGGFFSKETNIVSSLKKKLSLEIKLYEKGVF